MNDLTKYQSQMPEPMRRQLNYNLQNMNQLAQMTKTAIDIQADVYQHAWYTLLSAVNQAKFFLQAYQNLGNDDLDIVFQAWLQDLMSMFANYNQVLGNKLQTILAEMPTQAHRSGFWEELATRLFELIFGERPPQVTPVESMLQLGTGAKQDMSELAKNQVNNLRMYMKKIKLA